MGRTPDAAAGPRYEEELRMEAQIEDPTVLGGIRLVGGEIRVRDSEGVYNPRNATSVAGATGVGQILFSLDGSTFVAQTPLASDDGGWITNTEGCLLIAEG